jgi:AraC-like DNA-binding protein
MNDFPAIPLLEHRPYDRIRELYLLQEPMLLAAIRRGDRGEARRIINHVLVHIYSLSETHIELLKGLLLELVVMMSRAAVEAGAVQSEVLGLNFRFLTELANLEDDEELAAWLRRMLEHVFSTIERQEDFTPPLLIGRALDYMRDHLHRDISRDEVARHAGISPSHFSRLLKERTGRSFTELLRQCRVGLACDLLRGSEQTLAQIAGRCGFCDQSYFTHVFQEVKGVTPKQYRGTEAAGDYRAEEADRTVRATAARWPGVVPQQPPTIRTPAASKRDVVAAMSSAEAS